MKNKKGTLGEDSNLEIKGICLWEAGLEQIFAFVLSLFLLYHSTKKAIPRMMAGIQYLYLLQWLRLELTN